MFCKQCGATLNDGATFCTQCGAKTDAQPVSAAQMTYAQPVAGDDASENMAISILAYLGPLVFIPMFVKRQSPFAQYHSKQGLIMFALGVIWGIVDAILQAILRAIFPLKLVGSSLFTLRYSRGVAYGILSWLISLISIIFLVWAIMGIVNVCQKKKKPLFLIGKIPVFDSFFPIQ